MYLGVVLIVRKELVNWLWHVMIALLLLPVLLLIILMTKLIRNMNIFFMHIIYSKSQKILALLAIFSFLAKCRNLFTHGALRKNAFWIPN